MSVGVKERERPIHIQCLAKSASPQTQLLESLRHTVGKDHAAPLNRLSIASARRNTYNNKHNTDRVSRVNVGKKQTFQKPTRACLFALCEGGQSEAWILVLFGRW
jgi:hypothetical protein